MRFLLLIVVFTHAVGCADEPAPGIPFDSGARDSGSPPPDTSRDATGALDTHAMRDSAPDTRPEVCEPGAGSDLDGDGFPFERDCDDCDRNVNPGAFDAPGNDMDEDCDGADAVVSRCDEGLAIDSGDPMDAARAIGLCRRSEGFSWGVVNAFYTTASGTVLTRSPLQRGLLSDFGTVSPLEGESMLALSSGAARTPGQDGYTSECDDFNGGLSEPYPPGFPVRSAACPGVRSGDVFDSIALEIEILVPTNAYGFRFNTTFYTYEYPAYICDAFNDVFAVLRQEDDGPLQNIAFDERGEPISVNNSLFTVCTPGFHGGRDFSCGRGRDALRSTGFEGEAMCGTVDVFGRPVDVRDVGGATGWLTTFAPVTGGSRLTLRFAIWDSGDGELDSLALIDRFEWELSEEARLDAPSTRPHL